MYGDNFGSLIKKLRTKKGITQAQLADGICTTTFIYNIERGISFPALFVIEGISRKLDIDVVDLFRLSQYNNPLEIKKIKDDIERAYIETNLVEIEKSLKKYERYLDELDNFDLQRYLWFKGIVEVAIMKNIENASSYYHDALSKTRDYESIDNLLSDSLTSQEQELINSVIVLYMMKSEYTLALQYFEKLKTNIERFTTNSENPIYIKVLYNISYLYELQSNYKKAKKYVAKGIKVSTKTGELSHLYKFYHLMGKIYHNEGNIEQANFFFEKYIMLVSIAISNNNIVSCYIGTLEKKYNYERPNEHHNYDINTI